MCILAFVKLGHAHVGRAKLNVGNDGMGLFGYPSTRYQIAICVMQAHAGCSQAAVSERTPSANHHTKPGGFRTRPVFLPLTCKVTMGGVLITCR